MPIPSDWSDQLKTFVHDWHATGTTREHLGDDPFHRFVLTERASSWNEFLAWLNELEGHWCFRGQRESGWNLHTSLDRAVKREFRGPNSIGYDHLDRATVERDLLFRFQQQAHRYIENLPASDDLGSWFALMQHHGVPTRLLDWTQSSYVGLYFALDEEPQGKEKRAAIWSINLDWLENKSDDLLLVEPATESRYPTARAEYFNQLLKLKRDEKPVIVKIDPSRTNERMAAQQGFFLCSLLRQASFNQIVMGMMMEGPEPPDQPVVRKLEIPIDLRIEFLKKLRAMNIHRASLFPDLDGFGRSLRLDLEIKVKGESV
jgi:hypothetical protein